MKNKINCRIAARFLSIAAGVLLAVSVSATAAAGVPRPLVDSDWLEQNLESVIVLDVRKDTSAFVSKGHIPGARLVDYKRVRTSKQEFGGKVDKMLPTKANFETLMRDLGVNDTSTVVITTAGESPGQVTRGTRLYWQMRYFGHDDVALLNGGNAKWEADLYELTDEPATLPTKGSFTVRAERRTMLATLTDVEETVEYGGPQLVDTRTLDYYLGLKKKKYVYAAGHIPYSKVFPYVFLTSNKGPATFRPVAEIKTLLGAMQVEADKASILYCNSGSLATALWFVMHDLLGNQETRLFDGSMHQWTKDSRRPVAINLD